MRSTMVASGVLAIWLMAPVSRRQTVGTYEIVHHFRGNDGSGFTGNTDGAQPAAPLLLGPDGRLYGTTVRGTANATGNIGTVFAIDTAGTLNVLHHFANVTGEGWGPTAPLILGSDGSFYGTTPDSVGETATGGGTIFKVSATGGYQLLRTLVGPEGGNPGSGILLGPDGFLYAVTSRGGTSNNTVVNNGTVVKLHPSGGLAPLQVAVFPYSSYNKYRSPLILARDGQFYGVTVAGPNTLGTVYRAPSMATVHAFVGGTADGASPVAPLVQAADGFLYGTTLQGGPANAGTVYKISVAGVFSIVHAFTGPDGSGPSGALLQAADGNFYGTTKAGGQFNYGTIFMMTPAGAVTPLHSFSFVPSRQPSSDGVAPLAALVQGADGKLYGTTFGGGAESKGTIFRIDRGLPPPVVTPPPPPPAITDLRAAISSATPTVTLGDTIRYSVTVSNAGPDPAIGAAAVVTLPPSATFVSASPSQGTCSGSSAVTCSIGALANGASATVTIVATPASVGSITTTASVSTDGTDPAPANNSASVSTTVHNPAPQPDLSGEWSTLTQTCKPTCTLSGKFVLKNAGAARAVSVGTRFYLSSDAVFDASDTVLQQTSTSAVAIGGRTTLALGATVKTSASGKYVIAVVDFGQLIAESDEGNNHVAIVIK